MTLTREGCAARIVDRTSVLATTRVNAAYFHGCQARAPKARSHHRWDLASPSVSYTWCERRTRHNPEARTRSASPEDYQPNGCAGDDEDKRGLIPRLAGSRAESTQPSRAGFSIALRELRVGVNDEQSTILPLAQDWRASRKYQLSG